LAEVIDVIVVGAGLAGTLAAAVLGQQGFRVILVDPRSTCPPVFKAEKIEPDQSLLLRKFGLLESLLPRAGFIRRILCYYNGTLCGINTIEQYGMYYSDMVNTLRARLPQTVLFQLGRVVRIANSAALQRVTLANGEKLTGRFVVLACGLNSDIPSSLGLKRISVQRHHSVAIGFTLARVDGQPFPFDAVTYYSISPRSEVDYLSFFKLGETMRANLFAFPMSGTAWLRQFIQEPHQELRRFFPKLTRAIGDYHIVGKVETALIDLYRTEGEAPSGIALIGDAAQNVCPSTGMGLTKVLTDVDVLCLDCIPLWFRSGIDRTELSSFYNNARKRDTDAKAIQDALYRRRACTDRSFRWKAHRIRLHMEMQFGRQAIMPM
jgi:2-polyprenyl-6-methoxyphenol hydroxylase-like FAD-dependent oxidoreductase